MNISLHIVAEVLEILVTAWRLFTPWRARQHAKREMSNMDTLGPIGNAVRDALAG